MTTTVSLPDSVLDEVTQDLLRHEGDVPWLYCDKKGYVTIGVGCLIRDEQAAVDLPLVQMESKAEATAEAKRAAFRRTQAAYISGLSAHAYRAITDLRLPQGYSRVLMKAKLQKTFIPGLLAMFPEMAQWPQQAQRVVVDMAYSLGLAGLRDKFPTFVTACLNQDWSQASRHCTRASGRRADGSLGTRNEWAIGLLQQASGAM